MELAEAGKLNLKDPTCRYIHGMLLRWQEIKSLIFDPHFADFGLADPRTHPCADGGCRKVWLLPKASLRIKAWREVEIQQFRVYLLGVVIQNVCTGHTQNTCGADFKPLEMHSTATKTAEDGLYRFGDLYLWDRALFFCTAKKLVSKELWRRVIPYRDG